jgi:tetratricopeptide (TPR) repeat protein
MQSTAHLGHVVREQGRPQEAVELLEPAVQIVTREDFPDTIQAIDARYSVLFELALGYRDLRRYDAAITAARQAVDAAKKLDGGGGEFSQRALRLLDELESDDHERG